MNKIKVKITETNNEIGHTHKVWLEMYNSPISDDKYFMSYLSAMNFASGVVFALTMLGQSDGIEII